MKYLFLLIPFLFSCSTKDIAPLERVCNNRNSYQYFICVEDRLNDKHGTMERNVMNEIKKQAKEMAKAMNISEKEAERILINSILEHQDVFGSDSFYTIESIKEDK